MGKQLSFEEAVTLEEGLEHIKLVGTVAEVGESGMKVDLQFPHTDQIRGKVVILLGRVRVAESSSVSEHMYINIDAEGRGTILTAKPEGGPHPIRLRDPKLQHETGWPGV